MRPKRTDRRPTPTTPTAALVAAVAFALASAAAILPIASAQAPTCTQEVEPNDTPPSATPIDAAPGCLEGFLDSGDQDAFRWDIGEVDSERVWRVVIEQAIPSELTRLQLFDVDFTEDGSGVTRADMRLDIGSHGGARASSIPFLVTPGTLVFGVSSSGGEGAYRIALEALDVAGLITGSAAESEHEDAFAYLGPLRDGAHVLHWTLADDTATFTLDARAALGTSVELSLWDGDERLVTQTSETGRPVTVSDLGLPAGTYRVELRASVDEDVPVLARAERREVALQDGVLREREPNDTWETANELPVDQPLEGQLTQGDVDHFVFRSDTAFAQRLNDLVIEADGELEIALYDEERTLLLQRRGVGGTIHSLYLTEGEYGLRLSGGVTPYRIAFQAAGSFDESVAREPNDTPETAQPLGDSLSVRGYLSLNDVDMFSFDVPDGGVRYRVQALGRSDGVERLSVLDERGRTIESVAGDGGRARVDEVELLPGRYLLSVEGFEVEYALRLIDLGALDARPADLEARSEDEETAVSVATVDTPTVDARARAAEEGRAVEPAAATPPAPEARAEPAPVPAAVEAACEPPTPSADEGTFTIAYASATALACGDLLNLALDADRVALDTEGSAFGFMWVAASSRGTVIKIDTDTGEVKGEYWTGPVLDSDDPSLNPSRTVIDRNGNAWVGNRDDIDGEYGSVVRIGLLENGQCEDRNGNGVIDTSTGLGDVRPWTNEGDADRLGGVSTAEDECITVFQTVHSRGVRHVSLDASGGIWVSGTVDTHYDLLDPDTGEILRTHPGIGCGGYGGVVAQDGILWGARPLLRWDPNLPHDHEHTTCYIRASATYAVSVGHDGAVWMTNYGRGVCRYDPATGEQETCFTASEIRRSNSRGVVVTDDGHVWVAYTWGDHVVRFAPDGSEVADIRVGRSPTGLAVDNRGRVWVTNQRDSSAYRIDPARNEIDMRVDLNGAYTGDPDASPFYDEARPYTYSDMTGQLVFGPPDTGTLTLHVRGPAFANRWQAMHYDAHVPSGASLEVRVSAGSTTAGAAGLRLVSSGDALDLEGAVLTVEVRMRRAPDGSTPTFGNLVVEGESVPLDDGTIRVTAPPDLVASSNAVELILDGSGTMGQLLPTGQSRWEAARDAVLALAEGQVFPTGLPVALRVYGHIQPLSCEMRLEVPLEPFDESAVRAAVEAVQPVLLGRTPLADALLAAGDDLAGAEGQRTIVLLTDGNETCDGDPEAAIRSLRERDLAVVNIIGFALEEPETLERLTRWARLGGGSFFDPSTADELREAFRVALQPEFVVLDDAGAIVARGRVNGDPVAVPSGVYRVQVYSSPGRVLEGVEVRERDVSLAVGLRGP